MKILFVAMTDSVHTARWISQISGQGWDIHLYPSIDVGLVHPEMADLTAHVPFYGTRKCPGSVKIRGLRLFNDFFAKGVTTVLTKAESYREYRINRLVRVIRKLKPDIVHSLEIQHAGYLTFEAWKRMRGEFPRWILTNWGSDIYLFGRLPEHEQRLREVLAACDYYSCECRRDVCLAEAYGLKGRTLPVFPNAGGFHLEECANLRQPGPVSSRRLIMLKGYQHWAGRALVGLRALERCADLLRGYEVAIYGASPDIALAARLFSQSTGVPAVIMPQNTPRHEILRMHGRARISIGLSISDAISTSFLEALVMGSFPIQSWTACADEWIEDGRGGLLVPPEDPHLVEQAIRRALSDNELVDEAARINAGAVQRLDYEVIRAQAVSLYERVYQGI